jgi:hypothetical protein
MNEPATVIARFEPRPGSIVLSYSKSGPGSGVVSFTPQGGNTFCGGNCLNAYTNGTRVQLRVASVDPRSVFVGWTGACRGKGSCKIRMRTGTSVGAVFNLKPIRTLNYAKAGTGAGTVTFSPAGAPAKGCTVSCTRAYVDRTKVTLRAVAGPGSVFTGWSGGCRGKRTCSLTMSTARYVTATFRATGSASVAR